MWAEDRQFVSRLAVPPTAIDGANRQDGIAMAGGCVEADYFEKVRTPEETANEAAGSAVALLAAVEPEAGSYPVIVNHGWGGVLVHECFGHSLEGDGIRKKTSIRERQLGQKVCADGVDHLRRLDRCRTRAARSSVDDEGTPAQRTVLVEDGVLKGYLWDRLNAQLTGNRPTGNGRRNSYRDFPLPRMTNTYIGGGTSRAGGPHRLGQERPVLQEPGRRLGQPGRRQVQVPRLRGLPDRGRQADSAGANATLTGNAADAMLRSRGWATTWRSTAGRAPAARTGSGSPSAWASPPCCSPR